MLQSYFKLALKILARKKFFTFISLFGISFTLMILMLLTAFLDHEFGKYPPVSEKDRLVFLDDVSMKRYVTDTVPKIDSTMLAGAWTYDTTYTYPEEQQSHSQSQGAYDLLFDDLKDIQGAENGTMMVAGSDFTIFKKGKKLLFTGIWTDNQYWDIFDFQFIEGKPYDAQDLKNSAQVAVITKQTASEYFGKTSGVLGEIITLDRKNYEVIGLVETPEIEQGFIGQDVFLPYTNLPPHMFSSSIKNGKKRKLLGPFTKIFLAKTPETRSQIQADLKRIAKQYDMPDPENYNRLELDAMTYNEKYAMDLLSMETAKESLTWAKGSLIFLLVLFILLPTLNLININISRIMERSAEIGVRKAFGAHSSTILSQFVFENIILTLIGGMIGGLLAWGMIYLINESHWLGKTQLVFNTSIFLYSALICVGFGILSGIIPAWRMSKMQIVNSLKSSGN